jgi:hypothetical protein
MDIKQNRTLIIAIAVVLLLCCCCVFLATGYQWWGDWLFIDVLGF